MAAVPAKKYIIFRTEISGRILNNIGCQVLLTEPILYTPLSNFDLMLIINIEIRIFFTAGQLFPSFRK
jgi:hypothetical protein